ncbi:hypothetical protein F9K33_02450 [bacterium]|nr:MAG: hypothetical protein F9K33_02450 [bacterium]
MKRFLLSTLFFILFLGCDNLNLGKDSGQKPIIDRIFADRTTILVSDTATIYVEARDLNEESLDYIWTALDGGTFVTINGLDLIRWKPPLTPGFYTIRCRVNNESKESATKELDIQVSNVTNPIVQILSPANDDFIPSSNGTVAIHARVANVTSGLVDSMKCFVDNSSIGKVTNNGDATFDWAVTGLNGVKSIKVQAWTRALIPNTTTTDSTKISVSIEGTVSKRRP